MERGELADEELAVEATVVTGPVVTGTAGTGTGTEGTVVRDAKLGRLLKRFSDDEEEDV